MSSQTRNDLLQYYKACYDQLNQENANLNVMIMKNKHMQCMIQDKITSVSHAYHIPVTNLQPFVQQPPHIERTGTETQFPRQTVNQIQQSIRNLPATPTATPLIISNQHIFPLSEQTRLPSDRFVRATTHQVDATGRPLGENEMTTITFPVPDDATEADIQRLLQQAIRQAETDGILGQYQPRPPATGSVNGLTVTQINDVIETKEFKDFENPINSSCYITQNDFAQSTIVSKIKNCGHIYETASIQQWLNITNSCPMCRLPARVAEPTPPRIRFAPNVLNAQEEENSGSETDSDSETDDVVF